MRRIGRILINTATMLAVLGGAGTAVLWLRSHYYSDRLTWDRRGDPIPRASGREAGYVHRGIDAWTDPGRITVEWGSFESGDPLGRLEHTWDARRTHVVELR
jgi:hypothetical protein